MTPHGHLSVKNQIMPGRYHHRSTACPVRFNHVCMTEPYHNSRGLK